jgi:cyclic pyranopterin phosphate synthase
VSLPEPLADNYGRTHGDLRVSVTDRCNLRCYYCMPVEGVEFRPHAAILSFEEIERLVRAAARLGIRKLRLTGGEPLVRKGVCRLVEMLAVVPGIEEIAMTTNGALLAEYAPRLAAAGVGRLNISLDTLDRRRFIEISRCDDLPRVLEGIAAACRAGFRQLKLNTVAIRGRTEEDAVPLALFARELGVELRFIEFMPADGGDRWTSHRVLHGEEILNILGKAIGPLEPVPEPDSRAPAVRYRFADGRGIIGLIRTVSAPFCDRCGRLRLTAEGELRNCIFSSERWDVRGLVRGGGSDDALAELIRQAVRGKKKRHGCDNGVLAPTDRGMHRIGG